MDSHPKSNVNNGKFHHFRDDIKNGQSIDEEAAAGEAGTVPTLEESGAEDASGFSALGKIHVLTIQLA